MPTSKAVTRPEEMHAAFAEAFNAGDVEMLAGLYEPDGVLLPQPGQPVRGRAAIGEALRGFLALKGTMELKTRYVHESGDLALLSGEWTLTGKGPDGAPLDLRHRSAEVARRQADGTWKYVLDHPFGADAE